MITKHPNTMVIGLTGGIGSGKTAVSNIFQSKGVPVIDADIIARKVVARGSPGLSQITQKFGNEILTNTMELDRSKLRDIVFHDNDKKTWLNNLLHPLIREQMLAEIKHVNYRYCILVVPLLIENKLDKLVDRVLVVDCEPRLQLERALLRDQSNQSTIKNIIASQLPREQRLAHSDDIIENNGSSSMLEPQVEQLHVKYLHYSKPEIQKS